MSTPTESGEDANPTSRCDGATTADSASDYLPIADHGVIGDLRTAAVVGVDGRIDWFCCPRFDSPSVFGSLLDAGRGGAWTVEPVDGDVTTRQFYLPDSNVLVTRYLSEDGVAEARRRREPSSNAERFRLGRRSRRVAPGPVRRAW